MCEHGHKPTPNALTSSQADSRVKIFPMPDEGQDLMASAQDCFSRPFAWFANYDPDALCWRTWQRCLLEGWTEFSGRWPRSGLMRNGIAYRLPPLVPRISGTGCLWLPTPNQWDGMRGAESRATKEKRGSGGVNLREAVKHWPTPTATDSIKAGQVAARPGAMGLSETLGGQLNPTWVEWLMGFPLGWTDCEDSETQ